MSTHGPMVTDSYVSPSCFNAAEKNNTFFPWKPSYVHSNMQKLLLERYGCSYISNSQPIHLRKLDVVLSKSVLTMLVLHFASLSFILLQFILCRYLQFTLRLGSRSTLSSCPAPDQPGEGVLLHYSSDNGITWTLLQHYAYQGFHEPRYCG